MKKSNIVTKTCEFCEKKFETTNPKKKYCKQSCKTRAYELRKGKEAPAFLAGNDYDIITKEIIVKSNNPEHGLIKNEIQLLDDRKLELNEQLQALHSEYRELHIDLERLLFAAGGGGAGLLLTKNVDNFYIKTAAFIGGTFLGSQISFKSRQKKQEIKQRIQYVKTLIDLKNNEIEKIENEKFGRKLQLQRTPKQIETKQPKEIKIPRRKGLKRTEKKNPPFVTSSELANMDFELYKLDGEFQPFFGDIAKNTFITTHGQPGSGKSTFFLKLANYFTKFGMVLYVTPEEGVSPTFKQKLVNLGITTDDIHITAHTTLSEIRKALKDYDYQFCFIDSINMIQDVDPTAFENLRNEFSDVLFAIIMQSTKDGKFKGSNEYAHNSDINIKVAAGNAETIKNRFNRLSEYNIF